MDTQTADRLTELYLDYLDLGGGLMMLSGVVQEPRLFQRVRPDLPAPPGG